eukprot:1159455-Pelagomonas_calceolata.AAC.6
MVHAHHLHRKASWHTRGTYNTEHYNTCAPFASQGIMAHMWHMRCEASWHACSTCGARRHGTHVAHATRGIMARMWHIQHRALQHMRSICITRHYDHSAVPSRLTVSGQKTVKNDSNCGKCPLKSKFSRYLSPFTFAEFVKQFVAQSKTRFKLNSDMLESDYGF